MSAAAIGAAGYRFMHRARRRLPTIAPRHDDILAFERTLVERFGISPARARELAEEQSAKRFPAGARA